MPTLVKLLAFFALLAAMGLMVFSLAAGFVVYMSALTVKRPKREPDATQVAGLDSPAFIHTRDPVIMEPLTAAKERWLADRAEGRFDALTILSRDGLRLAGWYWPRETPAEVGRDCDNARGIAGSSESSGLSGAASSPRDPGKTVLLVHGILDSAAGLAYLSEAYHRDGWNVCAIDLRAHGESEGRRLTMGVREARDLALWIECLIERYGTNDLFLHGISLGGAVVLTYGGSCGELPQAVRAIVSDSSFARYSTSIETVLYYVVRNRFLARSIVLGASLWSRLLSGVGFSSMSPVRFRKKIPVPALLFHGQSDVLVPLDSVRDLLNIRVHPGDETVIVPDSPHIGAYFYAPDSYMDAIRNLYRRTR